ncbi:hypothetical protein [Peribacillus muralis]|uniref:hypothetical protein n=1 Tax=Peribacillus muralis TaxID=264697 RepID=UPI003D07163E
MKNSIVDTCALCGNVKELKLSHIIPKFVFRYLKKDSFTGKLRSLSNVNVPVQDGDKQYLLCDSCEGDFNRNETKFANAIFFPFKNEGFQTFSYDGNWLKLFITSVNWRTLYLDLPGFEHPEDEENSINKNQLKALKKAEESMRLYLKGEKRTLDNIESHIFFFDQVKNADEKVADTGPHRLMQGGVFDYTIITKEDGIYVFANLAGIIIITIIKKEKNELWKNTFVKNETGKLKTPQSSNSKIFSEIFYVANKRNEAFSKMSDKQREQIQQKIESDIKGFKESGSYQRIVKDQKINTE